MKRTGILVLAVLLAGALSVYAAEEEGPMMGKGMHHPMMHKGKMGKGGMMEKDKMGMHSGMMMKGMMEKTLVATSDGGVVVLIGNKLMKYDRNLKLVQETEIKIDMKALRQSMKDMMKNCPKMKSHGKGCGCAMSEENAPKDVPEETPGE